MISYLNPITVIRKIIRKLRYPKLLLLLASIYVGYLIYQDNNNFLFHETLEKLGYVGTFLAGALFSHGFTMGPAVAALLINSQEQNFVIAGAVATAGTLLGNYLVHKALRVTYNEEVDEIFNHWLFRWIVRQIDRITPNFVRRYILPVFAGIVSATPLPDEFTAALVHASRGISFTIFSFVVFVFNAFGIFIILCIGRLL